MTSGSGRRVEGQCWVCDRVHTSDEFPTVDGVPITYGFMGWNGCRQAFEALSREKRAVLVAKGHARAEEQ